MGSSWLILAHEATNSGAPKMLLAVLHALRNSRGKEWSCEILLDRGGPLTSHFRELGRVRILSHPWSEKTGWLARVFRKVIDRPWLKRMKLKRFVRQWQQEGGRFIYSNTGTNGRLLADLPREGVTIVSHIHELLYGLRRFNRPGDLSTTLTRSTWFLAVSSPVKEDLVALGVPVKRIKMMPNFLSELPSVPDCSAAKVDLRRRFSLPDEHRIVLGCGHLDSVKGTDLFVEIAQRVVCVRGIPATFIWVGGEADREFSAQVKAKAGHETIFVGEVSDVARYYAASDLVIVTSRSESFSLVALEAAALGKPVLGFSAARGTRDLLLGEMSVSELSVDAMSEAVVQRLTDPIQSQQQGDKLRERVRTRFVVGPWITELLSELEGGTHE